MVMDNTNTNIPETSIGEVIQTLSELYVNAINEHIPFAALPTPFLWGPFGIGKSEGVRQLADKINLKTGKRVRVTDVRLLLFSPVDLRGVPMASKDGFSDWLMPRIFDMDCSEETVNILFLDELSAAPQSVQAAAYQITLDRVIGEHRLPGNCIVIAAGNRTTDKSVAFTMPKALCNRLIHFAVRSDVRSWLEWAKGNDIDSRIIGFISFDNSRLNITPETSDMAFPTPRSWSFVSGLLKTMKPKKTTDIHMLISAAVGIDTAMAFEKFSEIYKDLPNIEDIFAGKCLEYPKAHQVLYALVSSLEEALREKDDVTNTELENLCAYASKFPADFAMTFFSDIKNMDNVKDRLPRIRPLQDWLQRNRRVL